MPCSWKGFSWQSAFEAALISDSAKGIQGQPVLLRAGKVWSPSESTKFKCFGSWGKDYEIMTKTKHKLDDHWTFGFNQRFNSGKLATSESPYDVGFSLSYKL